MADYALETNDAVSERYEEVKIVVIALKTTATISRRLLYFTDIETNHCFGQAFFQAHAGDDAKRRRKHSLLYSTLTV